MGKGGARIYITEILIFEKFALANGGGGLRTLTESNYDIDILKLLSLYNECYGITPNACWDQPRGAST